MIKEVIEGGLGTWLAYNPKNPENILNKAGMWVKKEDGGVEIKSVAMWVVGILYEEIGKDKNFRITIEEVEENSGRISL